MVVGDIGLWLTLKIAPGALAIHCIIHEQHAVPENIYERLCKSINVFNRTNNTINNKFLGTGIPSILDIEFIIKNNTISQAIINQYILYKLAKVNSMK